jgi:hypothetical protein
MVVLGKASALDVPVFDGADEVRLIQAAQLYFNRVTGVRIVLKEKIEPASAVLWSFMVEKNQITQP